jgi:putative endonuclease
MYYVYVLLSLKDNKFYIGRTDNLVDRYKDHSAGKVLSTKDRRPLELIYYEAYSKREPTFIQEKLYKSGQGRRILHKRF